jgi:hypothetical protein
MSDDEVFKNALNDAYKKLDSMLAEQSELDQRRIALDRDIARWSEKIVHLAALVDDIPEESNVGRFMKMRTEMGLTNAVREVLKASKRPLMPTQVRDGLIKAGFDVSEYQNILATLHITLKRLVNSKEALDGKQDGNKVYSWNPNAPVRGLGSLLDAYTANTNRVATQPLVRPTLRQTPPVKPTDAPSTNALGIRPRLQRRSALQEHAMKLTEEEKKKKS